MGWRISHVLGPSDRDQAHAWIADDSYWAKGVPRAIFDRALDSSLCFALHDEGNILRGIARVVTDKATFAYLCDVYVDPQARGKGAGKVLIGAVMAHPDLQNLRRFLLATRDAHGLYAQYGFEPIAQPERLMMRLDNDVYSRLAGDQR